MTTPLAWVIRARIGEVKTNQKMKDKVRVRIESQGLSLTRRKVRVNILKTNNSDVGMSSSLKERYSLNQVG
jgi:hypothetical protein